MWYIGPMALAEVTPTTDDEHIPADTFGIRLAVLRTELKMNATEAH